jgi:hypothetical protein
MSAHEFCELVALAVMFLAGFVAGMAHLAGRLERKGRRS